MQKKKQDVIKLLIGDKRYEEDYSKQGFQGDITHLFEKKVEHKSDFGKLTKSGEMKVENMNTLPHTWMISSLFH